MSGAGMGSTDRHGGTWDLQWLWLNDTPSCTSLSSCHSIGELGRGFLFKITLDVVLGACKTVTRWFFYSQGASEFLRAWGWLSRSGKLKPLKFEGQCLELPW